MLLPRDLPLSKFQIWNLEISSFEKNYSYLISCESHKRLKIRFWHFRSSENEWIWMNTWLKFDAFEGLREPLLSFELIYFRNSFCYRIENTWGFRYKSLGHVGPLGKNLNFLVSLGMAEILGFSELLFILKLSCSKPFHNTLNYLHLLQILKTLWSFIIQVTKLLKQTLVAIMLYLNLVWF